MSLTFLHHICCNRLVTLRSVLLLSKNIESNIVRQTLISRKYVARGAEESSSSSGSSSSDDSSSSDEEDNKKLNEKRDQTLNSLLLTMVEKKKEGVRRPDEKKVEDADKLDIPKEFGKIHAAAKGVAESLGGDVKKTESELLNHLLTHGKKRKLDGPRKSSVNLSELIVGMQIDRTPSTPGKAYGRIQRMIGEQHKTAPPRRRGDPSVTSSLRFKKGEEEEQEEVEEQKRPSQTTFFVREKDSVTASLLSDSKHERDSRPLKRPPGTARDAGEENSISASLLSEDETPARSFRFQAQRPPMKVDLFSEDPLGIFPVSTDYVETPTLQTWQYLQEREMRLAITHPPSNYFEEMIQWTEKGMLWKFPINNEDGIDNEADVPFSEHVFLEKHLVPWCPTKGPIRHFMELVCVGLSKNPYLPAEDKKAHILWYKEYFEGKRDLLKSVGIDLPSPVQPKLSKRDSTN